MSRSGAAEGRADAPARVPGAGRRRGAGPVRPLAPRPPGCRRGRGPAFFCAPLLSLRVPERPCHKCFLSSALGGGVGAGWDWYPTDGEDRGRSGEATAPGLSGSGPGPTQTWPSPAPFFTCSWRAVWLCRHSAGAAVLGWGGPPRGTDSQIQGRRGLGSRLQGPREEGLGVQTPESEGRGVGSWTPGSEGGGAAALDPRV